MRNKRLAASAAKGMMRTAKKISLFTLIFTILVTLGWGTGLLWDQILVSLGLPFFIIFLITLYMWLKCRRYLND